MGASEDGDSEESDSSASLATISTFAAGVVALASFILA